MLTFLRSRKRSDPSVVYFAFQVHAKKPTQCFVLWVSIEKPTYCQILTSFRRSNWMFVDVFIECVAWSYWWTWCVLPIICNSKHFTASLYSILTCQINFPPPHPGYKIFNANLPPRATDFQILSLLLGTQK